MYIRSTRFQYKSKHRDSSHVITCRIYDSLPQLLSHDILAHHWTGPWCGQLLSNHIFPPNLRGPRGQKIIDPDCVGVRSHEHMASLPITHHVNLTTCHSCWWLDQCTSRLLHPSRRNLDIYLDGLGAERKGEKGEGRETRIAGQYGVITDCENVAVRPNHALVADHEPSHQCHWQAQITC
jgi:hypothetical protein